MTNGTAASFNQRLLAQMVDFTLIFPVFVLADYLWQNNTFWYWAACYILFYGYSASFEKSGWKGTPGKFLLQLQVSSATGQALSWANILLRQLLKVLSMALFFAGFFMIYFHPKRKALHDLMSRTGVISKINPASNW